MIPKANGYLAIAMAALGVSLTAGRPAVAETMLDQLTVSNMSIAQVNDAGQCVVFVTVNSGASGADEVRVVGDFNGAAKLYTSFGHADAIIQNAKISAASVITIKRKLKAQTVADPVTELKRLHKSYVAEKTKSATVKTAKTAAIAAAVVQQWNTEAPDTAQFQAHAQLVTELASVTEVNDNATAKAATYGTALLNSGIDPVTYLAIVPGLAP